MCVCLCHSERIRNKWQKRENEVVFLLITAQKEPSHFSWPGLAVRDFNITC